jgi:hypothetical protein
MAGMLRRVLGLSGCLLALHAVLPANAEPFFVRVYGRTYKVDPPSDERLGSKPRDAMKALPADIAKGPGFKPSSEQVLAEIEERTWIARAQLEEAIASREGRNTNADASAGNQDIIQSLAAEAGRTHSPEVQMLFDRYRALNLLAREVRRFMGVPLNPSGPGQFTSPKLSPDLVASYRDLKFDPMAAYFSFRILKAAYRSGEASLLARIAQYPVIVSGKAKRTIRNRDQLIAAKATVLDPRLREVVAKSTFETVFVRDKGMMLGEGEVWITHGKTGFGLGAIHLE